MTAGTSPERPPPPQLARAAVSGIVVVATVVLALALWEARGLVAIFFLGFVLATGMRPGVEALAARGIPRAVGVACHYLVAAGVLTAILWMVVPRLAQQVDAALAAPSVSTGTGGSGVVHRLLGHVEAALTRAPSVRGAFEVGRRAEGIVLGIAFVAASAAFWTFERARAIGYLAAFVEPSRRRLVEQAWDAVELRLGRYVRGQLMLISFVAAVLSGVFFALGMPYWLALGVFAGLVEVIPVVGPLLAGVVSVGVAFSVSLQTAVLAAVAVYGLRLVQDYVLGPRVLGGAVGLPPLVVLLTVSFAGILFGPALVPLAMPVAAVLVALGDVLLSSGPSAIGGGRHPPGDGGPAV